MLCLVTSGDKDLERAVAGALRSAIEAHGPITLATLGSAVKRITSNLKNARLGSLMRLAGSRRQARLSAAERHEFASSGGRSFWAKLTAEERSAEMRKRAAVRKERAAQRGGEGS